MHVPRAYMPVMLAKGPAPFTARSVALGTQNGTRVVPLRRDAKTCRYSCCTFAPEQEPGQEPERRPSRWDAAVSDIVIVPLHVSARSCPRIWQSAFGAPSGREGACEASLYFCCGSIMELEEA